MAIPKIKTELENYLVYGVDEKNRRIFFGHPIDWGWGHEGGEPDHNDFTTHSVEMAVRAIKRFEKDHPNHPIELYMDSYGGNSDALMYLVNVIEASTCQFRFFGGGVVQSSATWVMAVCDERYLYEDTKVMVHNGSLTFSGNYDDFLIFAQATVRQMERLYDIFVENTRMPREFWEDVMKRDLEMSAQESIKVGLANFIVPKPKRGNLRKKRHAQMSKTPEGMLDMVKELYDRVGINPRRTLNLNLPKQAESDEKVVVDETPLEEIKKEGGV